MALGWGFGSPWHGFCAATHSARQVLTRCPTLDLKRGEPHGGTPAGPDGTWIHATGWINNPVRLRRAAADECAALNALILRSKAHWGYDAAFMEACRAELALSPRDINQGNVLVMEDGGTLLGMADYSVCGAEGEIDKLFVEPSAMGRGVGKALLSRALADLAEAGATHVGLDADPEAAPFYERLGFSRVGEVPSGSIEGRFLPRLSLAIATPADDP